MGKLRIAIVGGGMAGLSAAFELTRTHALRARHCVTVYQMGWRLGGKGASSRDSANRIIEHGLHIWFGFYENAFGLLEDAYREWKPPDNQSIKTRDQAFRPQPLTAIGKGDFSTVARSDGDRKPYVPLLWKDMTTAGAQGDGNADLSLWSCFAQLLRVLQAFHADLSVPTPKLTLDPALVALLARARVGIDLEQVAAVEALDVATSWATAMARDASLRTPDQMRGLARLLQNTAGQLLGDPDVVKQQSARFLAQMIDVGGALIRGVVVDIVIGRTPIAELDRMDFREWLLLNGAAHDSVYHSRIVRAMYDTLFQYCEGDRRRPSYGAGTAAQTILRMYGTYRESFAYEMSAGMGEVVIAPIYGVLKRRGVKFEFFHKLTGIELSRKPYTVERLRFERQAKLRDDARYYRPTLDPIPQTGNLVHWPDQPDWDQLSDSLDLQKRGLDYFESRWCQAGAADAADPQDREITLERPRDFDEIILAIPVGAFKRLNGSPGPCDKLIEASPRFRAMTEALMLVPSISVQAWCTRDLKGLGWPPAGWPHPENHSPASSTGPSPLGIWADMSHLLNKENWGNMKKEDWGDQPPASLHYFCDVLESDLHKRPPEDANEAHKDARKLAVDWLQQSARYVWPKSGPPFDWSILFAPKRANNDEDRIDYQVVRPNVDPNECCVCSSAGSTEYRLASNASGFAHLYLAGSWIDTGFNTECIEVAVMSGKQAARAICGSPARIIGEDFLHEPPPNLFNRVAAAATDGAITIVEAMLSPARR